MWKADTHGHTLAVSLPLNAVGVVAMIILANYVHKEMVNWGGRISH